jgi:splicing factor U2AF subunit
MLTFIGLFPLPGAPRNPQQFTEAGLKALVEGKAPPTGPAGSTLAPLEVPKLWALDASNSRQARRLVVSKLPPSSTEAEIQNFLNTVISRLNVYKEGSGDAVASVKKATSGGIAVVEFTDSTYATTALAIEEDIEYNGVQLEVRRPADYIVQPPTKNATPSSDTVSTNVADSTEKLVIKGLPVYLTSEQGLELVEAFGTVQSWILVSDTDSSESKVSSLNDQAESKGVAFLQFKDPTITPHAITSLNGMQLNDEHTLSVNYACVGHSQTAIATENPGGAMGMITSLAAEKGNTSRSRVLILLNMVTGDDLMDADEYDDILQDVKEECDKYGKVLDLQIPRPLGRSGEGPGVGKVFVRFENETECAAALKGLAGRKFSERTVVASYYPEVPPIFAFY